MIQWNSNEDVLMHDSNCGLATDWRNDLCNLIFCHLSDCMAFCLRSSVIIFEVHFFLSEQCHLECPLCFCEFVPSPFCKGAASSWSMWACSEPRVILHEPRVGFHWQVILFFTTFIYLPPCNLCGMVYINFVAPPSCFLNGVVIILFFVALVVHTRKNRF